MSERRYLAPLPLGGEEGLPWSKGLNLQKLKDAPHGIDLGAMEPGVARRVFHRDKRIHLAAAPFVAATGELLAAFERGRPAGEVLLVGRRESRTCNSWMHNVRAMVAGRERCVLYVHPDDAARIGADDGETIVLESRVHRGEVRVKITEEMRPGIVSLPHGWGHAASAPWQKVASAHAGVSVNDWTDDGDVESVVGQSILNGVPVRLQRRDATARVA